MIPISLDGWEVARLTILYDRVTLDPVQNLRGFPPALAVESITPQILTLHSERKLRRAVRVMALVEGTPPRGCRIAGTDVRLHITFILFLAWIFAASWASGGPEQAWGSLAFLILLFACVVATFAANLGSLIEVVNKFGSFFYGSILGVFLLAMIPRAKAIGAFVGMIAGMTAVGLFTFGNDIAKHFDRGFPTVAFLWLNVIGALQEANRRGATTVFLTCVPPADAAIAREADLVIAPVTGPEVIAGSTRMKAGTATKLVLNMVTTAAMVRMGKTYGNLMVDLQVTAAKLEDRGRRILRDLLGIGYDEAGELLRAAGGRVKTGLVMHRRGVGREEAERLLVVDGERLQHATDAGWDNESLRADVQVTAAQNELERLDEQRSSPTAS